MMATDQTRAREIFQSLSTIPIEQRTEFLFKACGGDGELFAEVERMLKEPSGTARLGDLVSDPHITASVHQTSDYTPVPKANGPGEEESQGTNQQSAGNSNSGNHPNDDLIGMEIGGRYRLEAVLGEGGMGTVYIAEQREPVKRKVALKVIKTGMNSRGVLARFDTERQALALMDHPNIARVYDGGTTGHGQPYFVMELVKGVPITQYCDRQRLSVSARLELFVAVCRAVQHAHQKGIIHRDLKPSNVLVTEVDGRPTPKVIDFGVAKATELKLSELSFADNEAIVGTPAYMSPEQADPTSMDIDTRTDVYALGVILYELLVGAPPIQVQDFKKGAILEMLRMVREIEPIKPSTRVSSSDALPNIAAERNIDPEQLKKALKGDLDWIVMKALEKDRERRYETANGFADDVLRHLASEPVLAAPPSRAYRMAKFVKKYRKEVLGVSSTLFVAISALTIGLIVVGGLNRQLDQANKDLDGANQELSQSLEKVKEALLLAEKRKKMADGNFTLAIEAVKDQVFDINKELVNRIGTRDLRVKLQKSATQRLKSLTEQTSREGDADRTIMAAHMRLGDIYLLVDLKPSLALTEYQKANDLAKALAESAPQNPMANRDLIESNNQLGDALLQLGKPAQALEFFQKGLVQREILAKAEPSNVQIQRDLVHTYTSLGKAHEKLGQVTNALDYLDKGRAIFEELVKSDPTDIEAKRDLSIVFSKLGEIALSMGQPPDAAKAFQKALRIREDLSKQDPGRSLARRDLASVYVQLGDLAFFIRQPLKALEFYQKAFALEEFLAKADPGNTQTQRDFAVLANKIGDTRLFMGRLEEALTDYQKSLPVFQTLAKDDPADPRAQGDLAATFTKLGDLSFDMGKSVKALEYYQQSLEVQEKLAKDHPEVPEHTGVLGAVLNNLAMVDLGEKRFGAAREKLNRAINEQKKALATDPKQVTYRQYLVNHLDNLIRACEGLGDAAGVAEARKDLERVRDADPVNVALDARLAGLLKGEMFPGEEAERLALAKRASEKSWHGLSADLWTESFKQNRSLGQDRQAQNLYSAACSAALAGNGMGKSDPPITEAAKGKYRQLALYWLTTDLDLWREFQIKANQQGRDYLVNTLNHWKKDTDLTGIREGKELLKLPQQERAAFQKLWGDVEALLKKAQEMGK